jgi:hypothetical protein
MGMTPVSRMSEKKKQWYISRGYEFDERGNFWLSNRRLLERSKKPHYQRDLYDKKRDMLNKAKG